MTDYSKKTVTFDPHPHLNNEFCGSIHPCQHAPAMRRILEMMVEGGGGGASPTVDCYLLVFLKFVQSVIPTIEYDFTMDVKVGKSKSAA